MGIQRVPTLRALGDLCTWCGRRSCLLGRRPEQRRSLVDSALSVAEDGTPYERRDEEGRRPIPKVLRTEALWTNPKNRIFVIAGTGTCARTVDAGFRRPAAWVEAR